MKWSGYDSVTSWLVSIYCCIIFTLNLIPFRLLGLMYVSFVEHYETNRETASIPIVMYMVVNCVLSPFCGMFGQKVGIENMLVIGNFLSAAGIGGCYIARDITGVSFFLGILYALGLSCSNPFLPSIIKKHFTKNFTSANGIIYSGSSIISMIIPPITYLLLDSYYVDGTFLIVSGIMLHSLPVAILVRYASKMQAEIQRIRNSQNKGQHETSKLIPCAEMDNEKKSHPDSVRELKASDSNDYTIKYRTEDENEKKMLEDIQLENSGDGSGSTDIASLEKLEKISNKIDSKEGSPEIEEDQQPVPLIATSVPTAKEHHFVLVEKITLSQNSIGKEKKKIFNFNVFKEPKYILIMAIVSIHAYICVLSWTTMLDYSRDKKIAKKYEKYFLMLYPLSGLAGRLCLGWVIDKKYLSQNVFLIICYLLMALSTVCMIWAYNFEIMVTGVVIFGIGTGAPVAVFPCLIYKFVKEENQTVAQASQFSLFGIMIFTTTPLIGYFRETRGSYDGLYYLIAAICVLSCLLIPVLFRLSTNVRKENASAKGNLKA